VQVGDLVRWEQPDYPEDNDTGVVIGSYETNPVRMVVWWFGDQHEADYEFGHPNVEVLSESR